MDSKFRCRAGAKPSSTGESHIALFSANPVLKVEDIYGAGELLFCRKVLDLKISDKLDDMIRSRTRSSI